MTPCSSGNSPTMSVTRSAFASSAARSAAAGSAPILAAIALAMKRTRSMRSACVPSLLWKTMLRRRSTRASSFVLRSWSKKNRASARRARSTRSLPWMIAEGSAGARLLTSRKRCTRRPGLVGEREVALVRLHRQDQAFLRHREERGVERPGEDGGPLDQRRHLVQQRVRHDHRRVVGRFPAARRRSAPCARRSSRRPCPPLPAFPRTRRRWRPRRPERLRKRWPDVMRPAARPRALTGTTSAPCSARSVCTGRTNFWSL